MAEIARDRSTARMESLVQMASQSENVQQCFAGLPPRDLDGLAGKQPRPTRDLAAKFPFFNTLYGVLPCPRDSA